MGNRRSYSPLGRIKKTAEDERRQRERQQLAAVGQNLGRAIFAGLRRAILP